MFFAEAFPLPRGHPMDYLPLCPIDSKSPFQLVTSVQLDSLRHQGVHNNTGLYVEFAFAMSYICYGYPPHSDSKDT